MEIDVLVLIIGINKIFLHKVDISHNLYGSLIAMLSQVCGKLNGFWNIKNETSHKHEWCAKKHEIEWSFEWNVNVFELENVLGQLLWRWLVVMDLKVEFLCYV